MEAKNYTNNKFPFEITYLKCGFIITIYNFCCYVKCEIKAVLENLVTYP